MPDSLKLKNINYNAKSDYLSVDEGMIAGPPPWAEGDAYCHTKIWHPNIDSFMLSDSPNVFIKYATKANLCIFIHCLKGLINLEPEMLNLECPLNKNAAEQFKKDRAKFILILSYFTYLY